MFTSRYPEFAMFASLIASVGAVSLLLGHQSHEDSFLVYLPLPHILPVEYIVELVMIFVGGSCSYGRVNTLTGASVQNWKEVISAFQPSIYGWCTYNMEGHWCSSQFRESNHENHFSTVYIPVLAQLADSFVLSKVKVVIRGRLRIALTGVAFRCNTQEFLTTALVNVIQGSILILPVRYES